MRSLKHTFIAGSLALFGFGAVAHVQASTAPAKKVTIKTAEKSGKYIFVPVNKTITVGTKVTWTDPTDAPHTVTSDTKSWKFNKKYLPGKTLSVTFNKAGTFKYHCAYHAGMIGKITVTM